MRSARGIGSVTLLIRRAQNGDGEAADDLLERYLPRLIETARRFQIARQSVVAGGSDFASVASAKLRAALIRGRLQTVESRENLWPLFLRMTKQEAVSHARGELALKRGGGNVRHASSVDVAKLDAARPLTRPSPSIGSEPSQAETVDPNQLVALADEMRKSVEYTDLISTLPGDLQEVAVLKLLGYRNESIARFRQCAERTVERKLGLIRTRWLAVSPV